MTNEAMNTQINRERKSAEELDVIAEILSIAMWELDGQYQEKVADAWTAWKRRNERTYRIVSNKRGRFSRMLAELLDETVEMCAEVE